MSIALLFGILFLATVDRQVLIPILPRIAKEQSVSLHFMGIVFSVYALFAGLTNFLLGPFTDKFRREGFLAVGLAILGFGGVLIVFGEGYWSLMISRICAGIGGGLLSLCTVALVGDWFSYKARGKVMGIVLSSYFAALILGVPLSVQIGIQWGWRANFLGIAILSLCLLGWVYCQTFRKERNIGEGFSRGPSGLSHSMNVYRGFLTERIKRGAVLTSVLTASATLAFFTFISGMGFSPSQISSLFVVSGIASLLGAPLAGLLSDHASKRQVFLISNSFIPIPLLCISYLDWGGVLYATFFVLMLLGAARETALQTVQTELTDSQNRGAYLALRNTCSQLGISGSVFAAGYLFDWGGIFSITVLSAVLTSLASLVFWLSVPEPARMQD
jgi:predicted MFS family arabinose efflux permease